jgi:sec-independent protein translocase protein TatA
MPSWIGPWEIAIVLVIILLIFGPRKLPELGSSLGKSIRGFKRGMKDGQAAGDETVAEAQATAEPKGAEPLKAEAQQAASAPVKPPDTTEKSE